MPDGSFSAAELACLEFEGIAEIHRRLVEVHYPLAEARAIDLELHRRTLQRLDGLLRYVDDVLTVDETR